MNKVLTAYTELDSIYDSRRGLLQHLMTLDITDDDKRKAEGDRLWGLYVAKNYEERRMDTFSFPQFGIDRAKFDQLWKERNLSHWLMYYPSQFYKEFIKVVIDQETLTEKPIGIKGITLFVNIFPYAFDEEMKKDFLAHCTSAFGGLVDVKLVNTNPAEHTSTYYKQYNYVFKYDFLIGEDSKKFMESLPQAPTPDTLYIVPNVLVKEATDLKGTPEDIIFAMSVSAGPALTMVPVRHWFYDSAAS
jgi:hypothetical protein